METNRTDELSTVDGADRSTSRPLGVMKLAVLGCLIGTSAAALLFAATNVFIATRAAGADQEDPCHLTKVWSADASARVLDFLSASSAAMSQAATERDLGAQMSPRYALFRTAKVFVLPSGHLRGVLIPPGMDVRIGDTIDFAAGRRDPSGACAYIPNLIKRVRG